MDKIDFFKEMMEVLGFDEVEITINQNLYPKPEWAVEQIIRASGLVEDICKEHNIGHPNKDWLKLHDPNDLKGFSIHGCCGCCCDDETKKRIRRELNDK